MSIPQHDRPPRPSNLAHLPLIRVPARGEMVIAVTCWEIWQIDTHFVGRRTLPHTDHDCPGCLEGRPKRYEAYITGIRHHDRQHMIIALTPGPVQNIFDQVPNPTQLRAHIITITRNGTRANGQLRAKVSEHMVSEGTLPPAPPIVIHMLKIWGLDASFLGQDHPLYAQAVAALSSQV